MLNLADAAAQTSNNDQRSRRVVQEAGRVFGELERRMMRLGNWLIALTCGSMGVFSLWFSYHGASLVPYAVGFFAIAFGLEAANHYLLGAERPANRR